MTESRTGTKGDSRTSIKKKTTKKTKKRKKSKSSESLSRPNSDSPSRSFSPEREQEEADFAEEMRVQFRPFDADTNLDERPLSRHDRASSREGRSEEKAEQLGGDMSNMFGGGASVRPSAVSSSAPRQDNETGSPKDTFQNVSLDDVGKNKEFYNKRPPKDPNQVIEAGGDTDEYDDDGYEDEFEDD